MIMLYIYIYIYVYSSVYIYKGWSKKNQIGKTFFSKVLFTLIEQLQKLQLAPLVAELVNFAASGETKGHQCFHHDKQKGITFSFSKLRYFFLIILQKI